MSRRPLLPYPEQARSWPAAGRQVLAAYDQDTVTVYQAYRPAIADFALEHQRFGGEFSFSRMSWIKPGFLWMMYRAGWATKEGQERVLAVHLERAGFDRILAEAVESSFRPGSYASREDWQQQLSRGEVRLQWDPDHDPYGKPLERRAVQLGLRGSVLGLYGREWIRGIDDLTPFVREQHARVRAHDLDGLLVPEERVYPIADPRVARRLGVDAAGSGGC
ncbi:MAG: DUF4291 domain-containing protein [Myxococcales bacterium]|nr:DUF4291 domain-containing protein [Myxococcales bacterium]